MNPQAGDMWEWRDKWGWNAYFLLINPVKGMRKMWKCLIVESNEPGEVGTTCSMSFTESTVHGWKLIA